MSAQPNDLVSPQILLSMTKYLRLANYLSAAQIYLKSNFLLEEPLKPEHIKERLLGHWGTVPGINFVYANLNLLIKRHNQESLLIVGPGHGYPGLLSNLYIEGTLGDFYPDYRYGKEAMGKLIHNFSWPRHFPSHANPETPGVILEGGELGYALGYAYGAAMDNPDLLSVVIVGDGEAETATTAASWHSNKFLNPKSDGAVLPIIHLNKNKICGPTIYGTMDNDELSSLFKGYGYEPIFVEGDFIYEPMIYAMEEAYQKIKEIQRAAREDGLINKPKWPMIILSTKKGWTGPKFAHGLPIEGTFRSHGIPLEKPSTDKEEFAVLKEWLESYRVQELYDHDGSPVSEIKEMLPENALKIGKSKHANCDKIAKLKLPDTANYEVKVGKPGSNNAAAMTESAKYLRDIIKDNPDTFRIFSPDESVSNRLSPVFESTTRRYVWPILDSAEKTSPDGRVLEVLSENMLTAWMEGYTLTGRHSLLVTYEAFMMIGASMVDQYLKFLHNKTRIYWRKQVPSLNFVLTSSSWRQEHNGISHQNPGFVSSLLNNHSTHVDIHYPVDANMLIKTIEQCLSSYDKVNVIVAGKHDLPQYLTMSDANFQMQKGIGIWAGASHGAENPDVVFAASSDYLTLETLAAVKLMFELAPEIKTRFVSVTEISNFNVGDLAVPGKTSFAEFNKYFTPDKPVIYCYTGYAEDIYGLLYKYPNNDRIKIHGYMERGTTTTPYDMLVLNRMSRYQLVIEACYAYLNTHPEFQARFIEIEQVCRTMLAKHEIYINANGKDMPEITEFKLAEDK